MIHRLGAFLASMWIAVAAFFGSPQNSDPIAIAPIESVVNISSSARIIENKKFEVSKNKTNPVVPAVSTPEPLVGSPILLSTSSPTPVSNPEVNPLLIPSPERTNLISQKEKAINSLENKLKIVQNEYTKLSDRIEQLNIQASQQCSNIPLGFQQGTTQIQAQEKLRICAALTEDAENETQLLKPIQNQEADILQRIDILNNFPVQ